MQQIEKVNITYDNLSSLKENSKLRPVMQVLKMLCCGDNDIMAEEEIIGEMSVYKDDSGHLHMNFVSKLQE